MAAVYKPGQGYWTRTMSAIGFGLIALFGGDWVRRQFIPLKISGIQPAFIQWGAFVVVVVIAGLFIYRFIGRRPKTVEFMIATESEMKKVNWSSRKEVLGMTWVVIGLTVFLGAMIFVLDFLVYSNFFRWIGVLRQTEG